MTINVKTAKTKELVDFYNDYVDSEKQIIKFRDRATAEKRVLQVAKDYGVTLGDAILDKGEEMIDDKFGQNIIIEPKKLLNPCSENTKIAKVIDALSKGVTKQEVLNIVGTTKRNGKDKKTKANTAAFNHWLKWNVNHDKGYGVAKNHEHKYSLVLPEKYSKPLSHKRKGDQ